ncbi:MAG: hypothetical protein KBB83_04635 [Alphaproteobacteria bacterium]|nr:hypothetical protein [Alphaproteobacteria bacterium]
MINRLVVYASPLFLTLSVSALASDNPKRHRVDIHRDEIFEGDPKKAHTSSSPAPTPVQTRSSRKRKTLDSIKTLNEQFLDPARNPYHGTFRHLSEEDQNDLSQVIYSLTQNEADENHNIEALVFLFSIPADNRILVCTQTLDILHTIQGNTLDCFKAICTSLQKASPQHLRYIPAFVAKHDNYFPSFTHYVRLIDELCQMDAQKYEKVLDALINLHNDMGPQYPYDKIPELVQFMGSFSLGEIHFTSQHLHKILRARMLPLALRVARATPAEFLNRVFDRILKEYASRCVWKERINRLTDEQLSQEMIDLGMTKLQKYKQVLKGVAQSQKNTRDGTDFHERETLAFNFFYRMRHAPDFANFLYLPRFDLMCDTFLQLQDCFEVSQMPHVFSYFKKDCILNDTTPGLKEEISRARATLSTLSAENKDKLVRYLSQLYCFVYDDLDHRLSLFSTLVKDFTRNKPMAKLIAPISEELRLPNRVTDYAFQVSYAICQDKFEIYWTTFSAFLRSANISSHSYLLDTPISRFIELLIKIETIITQYGLSNTESAHIYKFYSAESFNEGQNDATLEATRAFIHSTIRPGKNYDQSTNFMRLAEIIRNIPIEERQTFLQQAARVHLDYGDRLEAYYKEHPEAYKEIFTLLGNTPNMLVQLRGIPLDELENAVTEGLELFRGTNTNDEISAKFIQTFYEQPAAKKAVILENMKKINTHGTHWRASLHYQAFKAMCKTPENLLAEIVTYANKISETGNLSSEAIITFFECIPLLPRPQLPQAYNFSHDLDELVEDDLAPVFFTSTNEFMYAYTISLLKNPDQRIDELFQHWIETMEGPDEGAATAIYQFILQYFEDLGLNIEAPVVQAAILLHTMLDTGDATNPSSVYQDLIQKKAVPPRWEALKPIQTKLGDNSITLKPEKMAELGKLMQLDLTTTPNLDRQDYLNLIGELRSTLGSNPKAMETAKHIMRTTLPYSDNQDDGLILFHAGQSFLLVLQGHEQHNSYMSKMSAINYPHLESSKLKCVLHFLRSLENPEEKIQRLCQFFVSVRNCEVGQGTAIHEHYQQLPKQWRIQGTSLQLDHLPQVAPAIQTLHESLQTAVSNRFSAERSLMIQLYGNPEIHQAVHQIKYVKGLIGVLVGLEESASLDVHAGVIQQSLLDLTVQNALEAYYNHMELDEFLTSIRHAFNYILHHETPEKRNEIYRGLVKIHESLQDHVESFDHWVELDEETFVFKEMTQLGIIYLMAYAKLLDISK